MVRITEQQVEAACREVLEDLLTGYGFAFQGTYVRPRGVAVEFRRGSEYVFVVNEGNALVFDLIRRVQPDQIYRLSLNQMIWFRGGRSIVGARSWQEQLALLEVELRAKWSALFAPDVPTSDVRFCFPMSEMTLAEYLYGQRGR